MASLISVHRKAGLQGKAQMLLLSYTCRRSAVQPVPLSGAEKIAILPCSSKNESPAF